MKIIKRLVALIFMGLLTWSAFAQQQDGWQGKFEQLDQMLPTPNSYRTGSGAPGIDYWQQRADYNIDVEINDETQVLTGKEVITYHNNSPQTLRYLWLQLDQNNLAKDNMTAKTETNRIRDSVAAKSFPVTQEILPYEGGFKIHAVKDASTGKALPFFINNTMMRVDIPTPMKKGDKYSFEVQWSYKEKDRMNYN